MFGRSCAPDCGIFAKVTERIPRDEALTSADFEKQICPERHPCRSLVGSVPEVADAGENHGNAQLIGGGNYVLILHRPPWLNDRGGSGLGNGFKAIGEGKEGIRGGDRALQRQNGLLRAESGGVHAAHLPRANAHGLAVARIDDGVRLDVLADAPGKEQAAQFLGRRAGAM